MTRETPRIPYIAYPKEIIAFLIGGLTGLIAGGDGFVLISAAFILVSAVAAMAYQRGKTAGLAKT